jgi:hypothetical protein
MRMLYYLRHSLPVDVTTRDLEDVARKPGRFIGFELVDCFPCSVFSTGKHRGPPNDHVCERPSFVETLDNLDKSSDALHVISKVKIGASFPG